MYPHLSKALPRSMPTLYHVGSMKSSDKRQDSMEGNGLSVSVHPEAWARIAKLGGNPVYKLTKGTNGLAGRFLEFNNLGRDALQELADWGVAQGWAQHQRRWRVSWYDSEYDERMHTLMTTAENGDAEAQFMRDEGDQSAVCEEILLPVLSPKAVTRIGFKLDDLSTVDMLATFWVEDETELDGVWWDDLLNPAALSAPRGVICLKQLPTWTAKVHRSVSKTR